MVKIQEAKCLPAYKALATSSAVYELSYLFRFAQRMVSTCEELLAVAEVNPVVDDPYELENVDLFITTSDLAVAENGAIWVKDDQLPSRVLPFISQQLAVVISKKSIVATMHDAYDFIANSGYGYAPFIAGPSETADIA